MGHICKPKEHDELGFQNMKELNQGYILKLGSNLINDADAIWVCILRNKYGCGSHTLPSMNHRNVTSHTWKAITSLRHHIDSELRWVVNNRQQGRFLDKLLDSRYPTLANLITDSIFKHSEIFR